MLICKLIQRCLFLPLGLLAVIEEKQRSSLLVCCISIQLITIDCIAIHFSIGDLTEWLHCFHKRRERIEHGLHSASIHSVTCWGNTDDITRFIVDFRAPFPDLFQVILNGLCLWEWIIYGLCILCRLHKCRKKCRDMSALNSHNSTPNSNRS